MNDILSLGFPALFAGVCLINLVGMVFWIWALVDCVKHEPDQGNNKLIWILVIVLTGWIGALIYYFVRRPQRISEQDQ